MCQSATVGSKIWSCAQICLHVCVSLCVYKAALDGYWGRRWPDRCVCLGSGSAFHIPLWYSVLWPQETHPAKKCARSRSLPPSDCSLSFLPPPHISVSLSPFLWIIYSTLFFFPYVDMENHLSNPSRSITAILPVFFCQRSLDEATFSQLQILAAVNDYIQHFTLSQSSIYYYNMYFSFFMQQYSIIDCRSYTSFVISTILYLPLEIFQNES